MSSFSGSSALAAPRNRIVDLKTLYLAVTEAPPQDRQVIRDVIRLLSHSTMEPHEFFLLEKEDIIREVKLFVAAISTRDTIPASMYHSRRFASLVLRMYQRLLARELGLPVREPPSKCRLSPLPKGERPAQAEQDLEIDTTVLRGSYINNTSNINNIKKVSHRHIVKFWQYAAIVKSCGIIISNDVGISDFLDLQVLLPVLLRLPQYYKPGTILGHISALKIIAVEKLGKKHPSVNALTAAAKTHKSAPTLTQNDIEDCRNLNGSRSDNVLAATIWDLSGDMKSQSEIPGLKPHTRDVRFACAVAVEIGIAVTAMSAASLHVVNYDTDITEVHGIRNIRFIDKLGEQRSLPLGPQACQLIDNHIEQRRVWKLQSPWLFSSGYDRKKQRKKGGLSELIANNIEIALCRRVSLQRVQDSAVVNAIDIDSVDAIYLSGAYGHKFTRSFRARFKLALDAPLNKHADIGR